MGIPTIGVSDFAKDRHKPEQPYSHFDGTWDEIIERVKENWISPNNKEGYREGVFLVKVCPNGFFSTTVKVDEKTPLEASFIQRRKGEDFYVNVTTPAEKSPANSVFIVLYREDILEEDGDRDTFCDWEIVSVNASIEEDNIDEPIPPLTMARNFLHLKGGTQGDYTAEEFAKSIVYWSNKVLCKPK